MGGTRGISDGFLQHDPSKHQFLLRVLDEALITVKDNCEFASQLLDNSVIDNIDFSDLLLDEKNGRVYTLYEAVAGLPDAAFQLEGTGTLRQELFNDVFERAQAHIDNLQGKERVQKEQDAEEQARAT